MSNISYTPIQLEGVYPYSFTVTADFTSATWNTIATHEVVNVTGAVALQIFPVCQGDLTGAGSIRLGTDTNTAAFIVATTATNIDNGEIWASASPTANLAKSAWLDTLVTGDVGYEITTAALTGGSLLFVVFWQPMAAGSTAVAGTGGAL